MNRSTFRTKLIAYCDKAAIERLMLIGPGLSLIKRYWRSQSLEDFGTIPLFLVDVILPLCQGLI